MFFSRTLILFLVASTTLCRFPIRYEQELEIDRDFLFYSTNTIPISELQDSKNINRNLKSFKKNESGLDASDRNNFYVLLAKDGDLNKAESGFISLVNTNPKEAIPLLNLVRMYYITNEYETARNFIKLYIDKNSISLNEFKKVLEILKSKYRLEERAMLLEGVSNSNGYELYAWEELGKYFLFRKDFQSAEYYLQKILTLTPFNEEAIVSMAELCLDTKRWSELVDYGKAMNLLPNKKKISYYFIAKGYYERGRTKEALEWIQQSPDSERANVEFLILWRDSLLEENPKNSLEPLRKYFNIVKSQGFEETEESFLPTLHPKGREIMEGFVK
jgi:tetratricopeptide (TPR) repeat protein